MPYVELCELGWRDLVHGTRQGRVSRVQFQHFSIRTDWGTAVEAIPVCRPERKCRLTVQQLSVRPPRAGLVEKGID